MGSFGDKLKRERELRGVTLEEIAKATKIGTRALHALEDEHFDQLPGGIFNKGFVRAYAKFLGLDEEQMVADFMAAQGDRDAQKPDLMASLAVKAEAQRRSEIAASGGEKGGSTSTWLTLAILVLLTAGAAAGVRYYKMKKDAAASARAHVAAPVPQSVTPVTTPAEANLNAPLVNSATADPSAAQSMVSPSAPAGTDAARGNTTTTGPAATTTNTAAGSAPANSAAATPPATPSNAVTQAKGPLELQIHVSKATWVSVQADGKPEVAETLRDSATKTINAQENIVLTTGNSVDVTCNGKSLGILGTDNQRSQVRISANCKLN
ncbi:MAG TPA: RodZ domain-containing protein [Terriglobales bacterium]|nr:RodZ domain-containing protein [Terriglobales bacterium]